MIPRKLIEEINRWINEKKYGNIQINFAGGKIVNVNRVESIKIDMLIGSIADMHITTSNTKRLDNVC